MPLNDDNHRATRKIKDLDERVSNLEQKSRSTETPTFLVTLSDQLGIGDRIDSVDELTMTTGQWDNTGWRTSSWGSYE
ncbi:hypothetical protein C484_10641 [Natrialba taiwanensis DSM 12281]|uniref:Uncharacterized protein n=1 Tax=Natrialba taiwanensis DSM 12281 TaxID=1230458 RepID=L9ZYT7_9EURY|nr:hypothetical protein C484_10641 [Natrialba taiwanensis DSM 12281]